MIKKKDSKGLFAEEDLVSNFKSLIFYLLERR